METEENKVEKYVVIREHPEYVERIAICDSEEEAFGKAWFSLSKGIDETDLYTIIPEETKNEHETFLRLIKDETGETVATAMILFCKGGGYMKNSYEGIEPYESKPIVKNPLLDRIDSATLIAWFRCNSCPTCKWRKEVIDKDPDHDIYWCAIGHERYNIIDMVSYLGYSKE